MAPFQCWLISWVLFRQRLVSEQNGGVMVQATAVAYSNWKYIRANEVIMRHIKSVYLIIFTREGGKEN